MLVPNHFREYITDFLGKNPKWVWVSFFLLMINFPIELILLSWLSGQIFVSMANMKNNYTRVVKLTVFFFLAYFVIEISNVIRDRYDAIKVPELEKEIRNKMILIILEKNEIQYDNMAMGELVARFLKAPIHTFYAFNVFSKFVVPFFLALVVIGFYILFLSVKLGCIYFICTFIYSVIVYIYCMRMIKITEQKMMGEMIMFNEIEDTLNNMNTIFTSNMIQEEKQHIDESQGKFIHLNQNELRYNSYIKMIMSFLTMSVIMILFGVSIYLFRKNQMTKATLISVVTLLLFLVRFMGFTVRRIIEGMMTIGSVMDSNSFLEKLKQETFLDGTAEDFIVRGEIRANKITFRYSSESTPIFKNFSVVIPPGSRIVLMGDSGSGKSTFIKLILGFFSVEKGSVSIDGVNLADSRRSYLRRQVAYINQNTSLFNRTVLENILYGCKNKKKEEDVILFLKSKNLYDMFSNLKNGLQTKAGRNGENLSGGMRQVVLLLRCYFRDAPIVILDEATSSLDARHRKHATVIITEMFRTKTVIAVSHDQDILDLFNQKLVFGNQTSPQLIQL